MYPSIYYAVKDLFGIEIPFLRLIQSFGFFVAISFLLAAYCFTRELKRKEAEGLLTAGTIKVWRGKKVNLLDFFIAGLIGFILGGKLMGLLLNFAMVMEDSQKYFLSLQGNFIGGILGASLGIYMKYSDQKRELEKYNIQVPTLIEEPLHPHQHVGNLTLLAALTGIIGAKIFHNLENWDDFMRDPVDALLSFSGLTMYGGLICASIACIWYGKKHNIPTLHLIDACAPGLMLAYGVGRFGCQVAGDGDWGIHNLHPKPSWLSWAPDWVWAYDYPHNVINEGVPLENCLQDKFCNHLVPPVYPTPFYEAMMCIFLFFVLWKLRKRITTPGVIFCVYILLNGIERFFIEKIRVNSLYHINGFAFTQAELISSIFIILGIAGIVYFKKAEKKRDLKNV